MYSSYSLDPPEYRYGWRCVLDGYKVAEENDPYVLDMERAAWELGQAMQPGRWLVDAFPICKGSMRYQISCSNFNISEAYSIMVSGSEF